MRLMNAQVPVSVLDPACGDGALLLAIADQLSMSQKRRLSITGYETNGAAAQSAGVTLAEAGVQSVEIIEGDFLESCTVSDALGATDASGHPVRSRRGGSQA